MCGYERTVVSIEDAQDQGGKLGKGLSRQITANCCRK